MALSIYEKTEIINHSQDDIDPLATEQSWQILLAGLTLVFMRKCFFLAHGDWRAEGTLIVKLLRGKC